MESARIPYKQDIYGKDLYARVNWSTAVPSSPKAVAIILHGGGLLVGSSEMIPKPQVEELCRRDFVCVIPNYRLAPQVTATEAFQDCEDAFEWTIASLPKIMSSTHATIIDISRIVAMGHSSGGTLALHLASCKPVKAVTSFYPSLFNSDLTTTVHRPFDAPPFGQMPDFFPTSDDWTEIKPSDHQVSEAALARPGSVPPARNRWQMHLLKHGQWISTIQPDNKLAAIDPTTRLHASWPPVMIVQGEKDNIPGSELPLAERALLEMRAKGIKAELEIVAGETHMFDLPPTVGTVDTGVKWQAVLKARAYKTSRYGMSAAFCSFLATCRAELCDREHFCYPARICRHICKSATCLGCFRCPLWMSFGHFIIKKVARPASFTVAKSLFKGAPNHITCNHERELRMVAGSNTYILVLDDKLEDVLQIFYHSPVSGSYLASGQITLLVFATFVLPLTEWQSCEVHRNRKQRISKLDL
nr:methylphloroacetophenone synthase [Quercus suber]